MSRDSILEADKDTAQMQLVLRMGDNCLILGQQLSAWCGHAPEVEEDIALTNVALDLIGQARMWLGYAAELEGLGRDADELAFSRQDREFLNLLLVEQSSDDYGKTLMRQFLFDTWHLQMLQALSEYGTGTVRDIASKSVKEVTYHFERSSDLIIRLGDGSEDSHAFMQSALNELWIFAGEPVDFDDHDRAAFGSDASNILGQVAADFDHAVKAVLQQACLVVPDNLTPRVGGKLGIHGEHMGFIIAEMQHVPRSFPNAKW